ncbi:hypothetical protein KP509_31G022200 [Ceratopteris richardii]|uniref:Uncharacterized protein n=1 Tax=Ceratopteris richardii TaxID=49495 RepID=A0A8T2QYC4_CERRI|nr:hypothetical protein KP509_31G022200 [Ceratopteris richardii]
MTRKDLSQPYWLDPETGEGFFVKSARQLHIVWGDDMRYWHWASQPDSWFPERRLPSYPWMELDIGEFVGDKEMHVALKYQMMEIEGGQWKSGIIVDCLKIQPSSAIRGVAEGAT